MALVLRLMRMVRRCMGLRCVRMGITDMLRMVVRLMDTMGRRGLVAESLLALGHGSVAATMGVAMGTAGRSTVIAAGMHMVVLDMVMRVGRLRMAAGFTLSTQAAYAVATAAAVSMAAGASTAVVAIGK